MGAEGDGPVITVYRVTVDPSAPSITLNVSASVGTFDGSSKAAASPERPFAATVGAPPVLSRQFYSMAPGILVLPEAAWLGADDMYHCCSLGSELLAIETPQGYFVGINPLEVVPLAGPGSAPCDVGHSYAPIFRIANRNPTHLFCAAGLAADDFHCLYEEGGFRGLAFEAIWSAA